MSCEHGHCITCSDEGIEMRVVELDGDAARCLDPEGALAEVDVTLVDAEPGAKVLALAGVAIARLE